MTLIHPYLALPTSLAIGIPPSSVHLLSFVFTSSYVGSLYLTQLFARPAQPSLSSEKRDDSLGLAESIMATDEAEPRSGSRDHPDSIRRRIRGVGLATAGSLLGVWWVVKQAGSYKGIDAIRPTLRLLGIPTSLAPLLSARSFLPYLLAPLIQLGPIYATYLDRELPFQRSSPDSYLARVGKAYRNISLIEIRNYLVGPLTEEFVFRSTILSLSILGRLPPPTLIFGTPLWFGLAHAHHAFGVYRQGGGGRDAAVQAVLGSRAGPLPSGKIGLTRWAVFQLVYTTLFGWFASYLFIRTGSILPPLLSHVFGNLMGLYLPTNATKRHPRRRPLIWGTYVAGIIGFVFGIRAL